MTTLLFQLRDAARQEHDELVRDNLKMVADELDHACKLFAKDPTAEHLAAVNGHWTHGQRVLDFASKRRDGGGAGAGLRQGALLQAVA